MATFLPGQTVRHRQFGGGKVLAAAGPAGVRVYFDLTGSAELVRPEDMEPVGASVDPAPKSPLRERAESTVGPIDQCRLTVECLRQGLPPPGRLLDWTVGQVPARTAIENAMDRARSGSGSVLSVYAANGQGKSHLGRVSGELALSKGFSVFHAELDGKSTTFADGVGLLDALFTSGQLPPNGTDTDHRVLGLSQILRRAAAAPGRPSESMGPLAPFLSDTRWLDSEDACTVVEGFLSGKLSKSVALSDLSALGVYLSIDAVGLNAGSLAERRKCQVAQLGRVVELAVRAGACGALIVIDEFDHDILQNAALEKKFMLLFALAKASLRWPVVLLLLTTTPFPFLKDFIEGFSLVELGGFRDSELETIVDMTVDGFARAYPLPALGRGRRELKAKLIGRFRGEYEREGWGPRYLIRATIEACEMVRVGALSTLAAVAVA